MDAFLRVVRGLSLLCGILAAGMIAVSIFVVCHMVVMRYVLNASTIWQTEFVVYMMLAATMIGMPYVQMLRGHVNVDLLPIYLRGVPRQVLYLVAQGASLVICAIIAWHSSHLWWDAWSGDWHSDTVWGVPLWLPYAVLPLGFGLMCLQFVADLLMVLTGREKPFGINEADEIRKV
jgi:TRAP-type C4-dicarboxylate transport system permease small subunit